MSGQGRPHVVALMDAAIGAGYLAAGLMPTLVPESWRVAVIAMAEVSLAAAVAVPVFGAAVSRLSPDARHARRRVGLLVAIVCVLVPQVMLFRHPGALPAAFLAPLLPALTALLPLWRAAGESWPGLALEQRIARWLPLIALVVGALFAALTAVRGAGGGALLVLAGLSLLVLGIARHRLAGRPPPVS